MSGAVPVDFTADPLPPPLRVTDRIASGDISLVSFSLAPIPILELAPHHLTVLIHQEEEAKLQCSTSPDGQVEALNVTAGQFHLLPADRPVRMACERPISMLAVTITPALIARTFERLPAGCHRELPMQFNGNDGKVDELVRNLQSLAICNSHFERLSFDLTAGLLVLHLFERYGDDIKQSPVRGGLGASRQRRVLDHIDAHLGEDISLKALARDAGLSRDHFAKAFKASLGMSPHRYIGERRVHRAKELLLDRSQSITDVALDLGFASHSHFTDTFRKATGITPSRYRKDRI